MAVAMRVVALAKDSAVTFRIVGLGMQPMRRTEVIATGFEGLSLSIALTVEVRK